MRQWFTSKLAAFITGVMSGIALLVVVIALALFNLPSWLIVDEEGHQADIAVVLGGGKGSRLRKALSLYDAGKVNRVLLVDEHKWRLKHLQWNLCRDCRTKDKDVVVLEGSTDTMTDAALVDEYCAEHDVTSILVVTEPYHTRRASRIFQSRFEGSNVEVSVISSGNYHGKLSPHQQWWRDEATLRVILAEVSKILVLMIRS